MAEYLVAKRRHSGYRVGEVIAEVDDGHEWSPRESRRAWREAGNDPDQFPNPQWVIVRRPGVPVRGIQEPETRDLIDDETGEVIPDGDLVHKARFRILNLDDAEADADGCVDLADDDRIRDKANRRPGEPRLKPPARRIRSDRKRR